MLMYVPMIVCFSFGRKYKSLKFPTPYKCANLLFITNLVIEKLEKDALIHYNIII